MNNALVLTIGSSLLLAGVSGWFLGAPTTKPADSPVIEVRLSVPAGAKLHDMPPVVTLDISPETNMAVVAVATAPAASGRPSMMTVMMADLKTGKLSPIGDLVGKAEQGQAAGAKLSPDRRHLLVNWVGPKGPTAYVIDLPSGKPVKMPEGVLMAFWAGNKVALSSTAQDGKLGKVNLVDPSTGKATELPVRGMVGAGLPDGTILVGGNPKAPMAEISEGESIETGRAFRIGTDGTVLGDVAPIGIFASPPVVSDNGKFIAFQSKPLNAAEGPMAKYGFTILSVDGKDKMELPMPYFPIAVMDDGSAVVISNTSDQDNLAPVSWVSKDGKTVKEIVKAVSATVIGNSVIYTTNKDTPAIKTTSLPLR